jgi:hypothetical protein
MKHKNVSMIQYIMHKRTSTNKDKSGGKNTPLLARASRQTSMPTLNNTNEALLSSRTLKKHLIHHNGVLPSWQAQTRLWQQCIH